MQVSLTTRDAITPGLRQAIKQFEQPKPILEAMGLFLVGWTKGAFDDPMLRPSPWPARKNPKETHPLLKLSGSLWRSIDTTATNTEVKLHSDREYAAVHQLGGTKLKARPFMPFLGDGSIMPEAKEGLEDVGREKVLSMLG